MNMQKTLTGKSISMGTLGLGLSLLLPAIYTLLISPNFLKPQVEEPSFTLINLAVFWLLALGVLLFTSKGEKLPLASIGWKRLSWKEILSAVGIGILLSLLVPLLTLLTSKIIPSSGEGTIAAVTTNFPWWILLLSTTTAGVTEEILFRGYPLERLLAYTGNKWLSGLISLVFFVAVHAASWNFAHIIGVVIPLGVFLTGLYFWKRNLLFVMIIHTVIDLPLVFMAFFA